MGSHSLLVARERLTMHLSWILIVFQIISSQIYGIHTSNYRANLTPSTVSRHFTLYETENDTSNGVFKNLELFKKTVTNAISRMTNMIGIPRIESRQDVGSFFLAILIGGIFPLLGFIAIQLQESSSSSSKSKSRFPVDCVWNSWSPCSRTCGGGTQTRDVLQVDKDGGIPCVGPTLNHCNLQACPQVVAAAGQRGSVQGNLRIGGTRRRRGWAIFGKDDIKNILKEAFCDNIISGSIVTGSCDLQVLDYNTVTGLAKYILSFEILDAIALEKSLYIINRDIATNTAITASGQSALPGTIVGASELVQGHLEMCGLGQNWRARTGDTLDKEKVKDILKGEFCTKIPSCSIVTETCDLQVLYWDQGSGVADYILTFDQLKLEDSLKDINAGIAKIPAITASGQSVLSGTIGKPTFSATPCPGGVALAVDGSGCPDFSCENDDNKCKNGGRCNDDGNKCDCTTSEFTGIDCDIPRESVSKKTAVKSRYFKH